MDDNNRKVVSTEQIDKYRRILLQPPSYLWLVTIAFIILISMFQVSRTAEGTFEVTFHMTSITAILVVLIWLPTFVRVVALLGFALKTPAGEVSTTGLLKPVFDAIATLESVEPHLNESQKQQVTELRREAGSHLVSLAQDTEQVRQQLRNYAQDYEQLRRTMPYGYERTTKMGAIVAQVQALAREADYAPEDIRRLFEEGSDGRRIVALGLLRALPDPACLDLALQAIAKPRSAFEQYHALRAAENMLPSLNATQKDQLKSVIQNQRSDDSNKPTRPEDGDRYIITPKEEDRWYLTDRILAAINSASKP